MQINSMYFSNQNVAKILHGELEVTHQNLTEALEQIRDRNLIINWATQNLELVNRSEVLRKTFYTACEIAQYADFDNDIIGQQSFTLGHTAFRLLNYIKSYFCPVKSNVNLDLIADKIRSKNIGTLLSLDNIIHINECFNCGLINSNDIENLIDAGLEIKSEKYINISKDTYKQRVELLNYLIEICPLDEGEKLKFKAIIASNERQEQRLLLQYAKKHEIELIKNEFNNQSIEKIADLIIAGEWMPLLEAYGKDEKLAYVLLAAYCQKRISLDDIATAMILHRAYFNASEKIQICKIDSEYIKHIAHDQQQSKEWQTILEKLPQNQRIAVVFDYEALDQYTQQLIFKTFEKTPTPGVFEYKDQGKLKCGLVSFGLAKAYYKSIGMELVPILHLTSKFSSLASRIAKHKSDFALFLPSEEKIVHGSQDKMIFSQMHDLLHTFARSKRIFMQRDMMEIVMKIIKNKNGLPPYRQKLASDIGLLHSKFAKKPNQDELVAFLLNAIIGELIDAGYSVTRSEDDICYLDVIDRAVQKVVEDIINRTMQDLKIFGSDPELTKEFVKKRVLEKL